MFSFKVSGINSTFGAATVDTLTSQLNKDSILQMNKAYADALNPEYQPTIFPLFYSKSNIYN